VKISLKQFRGKFSLSFKKRKETINMIAITSPRLHNKSKERSGPNHSSPGNYVDVRVNETIECCNLHQTQQDGESSTIFSYLFGNWQNLQFATMNASITLSKTR
jgi:hypothetical protein